jgi:glucose-1-phosphate adenylyltransferase
MDHIGTGKPWDLARKREGLYLLPPFNTNDGEHTGGKAEELARILGFISRCDEEYVILTDCNNVCSIDFNDVFGFHEENGADITIVCKNGKIPNLDDTMVIKTEEGSNRIASIAISPNSDKKADYSVNITLMRKSLLERLIREAVSFSKTNFEKDIIQKNVKKLNICAYKTARSCFTIDSLESYFAANMELLKSSARSDLFSPEHPVYTKVRDDMPVIYGLGCEVKNSLIADGCIIEGTVENCILFRGVRVDKDAVIKNSILMQGTYISEGVSLNCVIADKSAVVTPKKVLSGAENYPMFIGKGIVI